MTFLLEAGMQRTPLPKFYIFPTLRARLICHTRLTVQNQGLKASLFLFLSMTAFAAIGCSDQVSHVAHSATAQQPLERKTEVDLPSNTALRPSSTAATVPDLRSRKQGMDWPGFLGPTADSKSSEKGLHTDWSRRPLRIVWQRQLGTSYGMPTISRGRLFQFDGRPGKPRLVCMESETGKELWHFEYASDYEDLFGYENGPRCSPVVDDDRVYIFGAEGMLHCLDVRDGAVRWKINTAAKFNVVQNFFGVGSTPVIEGDLLIAQIGGSPASDKQAPPGRLDLVRGNGSGIVALDKHTGDVMYQRTDELASYAAPVLATINGRRWCFVFARGGLIGFEPASGKIDFHFPWRAKALESVNASNPVVVGDLVFISETYGPGSALLRVRPGAYEVIWSDSPNIRVPKAMQTHWNTPVHHAGFLYGSSGRHSSEAELRCIELATGKVQWSEPDLNRSSLLYVDGHFICLTEYGELILLRADPQKYDEIARVRLLDPQTERELLHYPCWAAPILAHGLLYVRGKDRLVCLELIEEV
jgi:outer membrane protein assembly factor BamB